MFGQPMNRGNRIAVLRQVGSLIESPSYYGHLTGAENLRIVQTLRGLPPKAIREVLEIVRLEGQRGKKVCHYSLGMKQRLGLAVALLGIPRLLVLDEPTNGLDPAGIQEMRELIRSLPGRFGMTVVVSSHLLSEIDQMADHVGIIREGGWCFRTPCPRSMGAAATIWPCEPPTMRWPPRCSGRRASAGRRRGTIWSCPFSRTSGRPGCAGLWWRDAWGWSAWRSGRRAWRTSSWSSQGKGSEPMKLLRMGFFKCRRRKIALICLAFVAVQLAWMGRTLTQMEPRELAQGWMSLLYNLAVIDAVMLPLTISALASRNCEMEHKGSTWKLWETVTTPQRLFGAKLAWGAILVGGMLLLRTVLLSLLGLAVGFPTQIPWGKLLLSFALCFGGEFCDLCLAAGPVPLVCQPGGAAGGGDFRQLCGAVCPVFFPSGSSGASSGGYYGVLIQAGMNWDPVTRATEFLLGPDPAPGIRPAGPLDDRRAGGGPGPVCSEGGMKGAASCIAQ